MRLPVPRDGVAQAQKTFEHTSSWRKTPAVAKRGERWSAVAEARSREAQFLRTGVGSSRAPWTTTARAGPTAARAAASSVAPRAARHSDGGARAAEPPGERTPDTELVVWGRQRPGRDLWSATCRVLQARRIQVEADTVVGHRRRLLGSVAQPEAAVRAS